MASREDDEDRDDRLRKFNKFLSEYQSHSSELKANKLKNMPSAKIMRKLRQLWNRQRFLTDDEADTARDPATRRYLEDSSMDYEFDSRDKPQQGKSSQQKIKKQGRSKRQMNEGKPLHPRQSSSSDQNHRQPNKVKKKKESKPESKRRSNEQYSMQGQLSQIEAFNSAIEGFSSS